MGHKALTENQNSVFAASFAKDCSEASENDIQNVLKEYPELGAVVKSWPKLSEHTKAVITTLIKAEASNARN